jgi:hypothetical protein
MLFGTFHIMHGARANAVSIYEKDYPNLTFVISDLGYFDTNQPSLSVSPLASWPIPSLAQVKGTWLGGLNLGQFLPPATLIDKDCNVHHDFPKELQKPMAALLDALLYLGPQDLILAGAWRLCLGCELQVGIRATISPAGISQCSARNSSQVRSRDAQGVRSADFERCRKSALCDS